MATGGEHHSNQQHLHWQQQQQVYMFIKCIFIFVVIKRCITCLNIWVLCVLSGRWIWTVRTCSDSPGYVPLWETCAHHADLTRAPLKTTWKSSSLWTTLGTHHHGMRWAHTNTKKDTLYKHNNDSNSFVRCVFVLLFSLLIEPCNVRSQMRVCAVDGEILVMQARLFLKDKCRPVTFSSLARCLLVATDTTPTLEPSCPVRKVGVICYS